MSLWEKEAIEAEKSGHLVTLLRTGIVLSNNGGAFPKMFLPVRLFLGGKLGSGNQILSWIHINDYVNAVRFLIEKGISGPVNLTSEKPVNQLKFVETLGKLSKRPVFFKIPGFFLTILFSEGADVLLKGQNVFPEKLIKKGFRFKYDNLEYSIRDLLKKISS